MGNRLRIAFSAILILITLSINGLWAQTTVHSLPFGGTTRSYRLHLPPGYNGSTAVPLVFNLHGYTSNALQQEFYSGMNGVADTAGFIVVYPDGINNSWNSGFVPPYYGGNVDDVGFISVLIDSLQADYNIDPTRVYSCGMSNGGFMSYRLACDLEDRIAAIASVTGSMTSLQINNCQCTRPMPILEIHGTNDGTVPYTTTSLSLGIDSVLSYWRHQNACLAPPVYDSLPNISTTDSSTVTTQYYGGCDAGSEVLHYKIENGGHTWPGAIFQITGQVTNQDIHASVEIWKFFYRYAHPNPVLTGRSQPLVSTPVIAPQPSRDCIRIANLQPESQVELWDLSGKRLGVWAADAAQFRIDASTFPSGMYLVRIQSNTAQYALKACLVH